jgi:acetate kinase
MVSSVVLVFNCGSSSIKFELLLLPEAQVYLTGTFDSLGSSHAQLIWQVQGGAKQTEACAGLEVQGGLEQIVALLHKESLPPVDVVVHRVVHGGAEFSAPVVMDAQKLATLKKLIPLAPLHNPANIMGIELAQSLFSVPSVAVFDTAFHATMPEHAYLYPLPYAWYEDYGVRRYGFHGVSHAYVVAAAQAEDAKLEGIISAHLGNGASLAAAWQGQCIDTTMGMTPLEGLMMGTRCGTIDPGLIDYLVTQTGQSVSQVTQALNKESGLLGISGVSHDMRQLEERGEQGDLRCQLARRMFAYRLVKQIAALAVTLPRFDALLFTGGIGENDRAMRAEVVQALHHFGLVLDDKANDGAKEALVVISAEASLVKVLVLRTNEALEMARQAVACLGGA